MRHEAHCDGAAGRPEADLSEPRAFHAECETEGREVCAPPKGVAWRHTERHTAITPAGQVVGAAGRVLAADAADTALPLYVPYNLYLTSPFYTTLQSHPPPYTCVSCQLYIIVLLWMFMPRTRRSQYA